MKGLFYPAIQAVSQSPRERGFGWGEQPGFRLWSPGVMTEPRAEKSGESLPQACLSIYSRFHGKSSSTLQHLPHFKHILYTHIYVFASTDTSLGFFLFPWVHSGRKQKKSNLFLNPVPTLSFCVTLLDTDFWWKELFHPSSVCEYTSCNIPVDYFVYCMRVCVCVCVFAHVSGRVYLGWVNVIEHYYGCAVVVQHQSPEILHRVWQRVLGHYECRRLLVTLEKREENRRRKRKVWKAVTKYTSCILYNKLSWQLTKKNPITILKWPPSFDLWVLFSNGGSMSREIIYEDVALLMWFLAPKDSPVVTERIPYLKGHLFNPGKSQKVHHWTRALSRCSLLGPPWINLTLENCYTLQLGC